VERIHNLEKANEDYAQKLKNLSSSNDNKLEEKISTLNSRLEEDIKEREIQFLKVKDDIVLETKQATEEITKRQDSITDQNDFTRSYLERVETALEEYKSKQLQITDYLSSEETALDIISDTNYDD
jgi:predicted RNase H-like nuclease